jgi:OOP family OmpA-OmpF porin
MWNAMNFRSLTAPAVAVAVFMLAGLPASAQTTDASGQSAAEIGALFKQQTRGLVIAPSSSVEAGTDNASAPAAVQATEIAPSETYVEIPKDVQVNISVKFDFDSSALRSDQKPKLASLCQAIRSADIKLFRIVGHTDASGSSAYNDQLSSLRAQEVKRHLVSECGIPAGRLEAVGVGERYPYNAADPNGDENRRVEFQAIS